jgi:hypothetical protein
MPNARLLARSEMAGLFLKTASAPEVFAHMGVHDASPRQRRERVQASFTYIQDAGGL